MHCGIKADRIQVPFGIIGLAGPGMRQVVGFGDRSTGRGTFGDTFGGAIVSNGDFTAYVCDGASTVGAAVWGGACGRRRFSAKICCQAAISHSWAV